MNTVKAEPNFARIWRGRTTREKADEYQRYWLETGVDPPIRRGAISVQMLRDDRKTGTEFVTISYWATIEAMTGGTGADPRRAHHLDRDEELLLELPDEVQILTILESRNSTAA
jgi:heme-degrading monooxygenase HmoA